MNLQAKVLTLLLTACLVTLASRAAAEPQAQAARDAAAPQAKENTWEPRQAVVDHWNKRRSGDFIFDESDVPDYELPDPLVFSNGQRVESKEQWAARRRPELMEQFRNNIYGVRPDTAYQVQYEEIGRRENAFNLGATARQIRATVTAKGKTHKFEFVFVTPKSETPVPIIVLINNRGLIGLDDAVGKADPFWPVEMIVRRGYATVNFHTSDVDPDKKDGYASGVRALLDDPDSDPATRWASISAWGWAASRVLDYALEQPEIDPERTAVLGHSRGGKTALWAGAEDTRFKVVYSNNSGCGGAALSKRALGETVARINKVFPHWFCGKFKTYNGKESTLPIDQHQLIAMIAPRSVYVASADEDLWADPRGEYESLVAAGPVYALHGKKHIENSVMPPLDTPRHVGSTGYHIRTGKHNLTEQDWHAFLDFTRTAFDPKPVNNAVD